MGASNQEKVLYCGILFVYTTFSQNQCHVLMDSFEGHI